ncbi:Sua5/YciO/YrdC/YwlC family protein [Aquisalimonas lutea]|uniref:L-threonylcarbamoyladenylate synthase n=1 Tax=Aquisalimonas lutea TaxID=1327750 RepID=UPI0025B2E3AF|nr:Sua5/YciO/YrdC/YwlC family protein [Aquisalimonas lutea]MDN3516690.1 Sua5/YciO/YrdC/YwlC family protein [Aquisalimonas lutea]
MNPRLLEAQRVLRRGGLIAYPTEAVFGLGCDPLDRAAVTRLLRLKGRSPGKGVILLAGTIDALLPYLAATDEQLDRAQATWPGPVTWTLPCRADVPVWLRGGRRTLAVRVTAHPVAAQLSNDFGDALISTSANRSGAPPARTAREARWRLGSALDTVVPGATGGRERPTEIRDGVTGAVLRH